MREWILFWTCLLSLTLFVSGCTLKCVCTNAPNAQVREADVQVEKREDKAVRIDPDLKVIP